MLQVFHEANSDSIDGEDIEENVERVLSGLPHQDESDLSNFGEREESCLGETFSQSDEVIGTEEASVSFKFLSYSSKYTCSAFPLPSCLNAAN